MSEEELFDQLLEIVFKLGWDIAVPKVDDDDDVPGLIIGTPEYLDDVLSGKFLDDDYSGPIYH